MFRREKEGLHENHVSAGPSSSPPVPPIPTADDTSHISKNSSSNSSASGRSHDGLYDIDPFDTTATVEDVLDISALHSSLYMDSRDDVDDTQRLRSLATTPPLLIDKRLTRLTAQPPRISFHQEGSLEDWSSALFSAIDSGSDASNGARSTEDEKAERRTTLRPMSSLAQKAALMAVSPAPKLADVSFGRDISLGAHVRQAPLPASSNGVEQQVASDIAEEEDVSRDDKMEAPKELDEPCKHYFRNSSRAQGQNRATAAIHTHTTKVKRRRRD